MKSKYIALALAVTGSFLYAGKVDKKMSERDFLIESYSDQYCDEIAFAYGDGLMSAGGTHSIDELTVDLDLAGKTVLDFGSGLGGMAFYLAQKHQANVIGCDINEKMLERATQKTPKKLKEMVSFSLIGEDGVLPLANDSVDVVLSKEVILHLAPAARLQAFKEFLRVLKPGGQLRIMDWVSPYSGRWGKGIEQMMAVEDLIMYAQTVGEYKELLSQAGLSDITFVDQTAAHIKYNKDTMTYLRDEKQKNAFIDAYGQQEYDDQIEGYLGIADSLQQDEVIIGIFKASKKVDPVAKRDFLVKSYNPAYCRTLSLAYGDDNMMSEGGASELGLLLDDIDVTGKTVLDFGCGMGGNTFFFVQNYGAAQAIGIDINKEMLENATVQTPNDCKGKVTFQLSGEDNSLPVADESVDLVFAKGALCHLTPEERVSVYHEFLRVLKPEGRILFMEPTTQKDGEWPPEVVALEEAEDLPVFAQKPSSWILSLQSAGFADVTATDVTSRYIAYNKEVVERLQQPSVNAEFFTLLSEKEYVEQIEGYRGIVAVLTRSDVQTMRFTAHKPPVSSS